MENDKDGEETLRLVIEADGKQLKYRFPRWGKWNEYAQNVYELLTTLSITTGDIEINNIADFDQDKFSNWSALLCIALQFKKVQNLVDKIFFTYLDPRIEGMECNNMQKWCKENLGFDLPVKIFIAILHINDWYQKKTKSELMKILQRETQQPSTPASTKNSDGNQQKLIELVHSKSVSF
jgi:hypothetical protein